MKQTEQSKVLLLTGAGNGVGRALAKAFSAQGILVAAHDLTPINLDRTVSEVHALGGLIEPYIADFSSKLALQTLLDSVLDRFGRVDYLINTIAAVPTDSLLEIDEWDWRRAIDQNLTGPFLLIQSVGRIMQAQGGGQIIHFGTHPEDSPAGLAGISGMIGLIRASQKEFGTSHIQINGIFSGFPEAEQIPAIPEDPVEIALQLCLENPGLNGKIIQARLSGDA